MNIPDLDGYTGTVAYIHNQVGATLGHLDAKASILSGMAAAGLLYMAGQPVATMMAGVTSTGGGGLGALPMAHVFYLALSGFAAGLLLLSFCFSVLCILPRSVGETDSIMYFRSIRRNWDNASSYAESLAGLTQPDIAENIAKDTFNLSLIAERKFSSVAAATNTILSGAILLLIAQLVQILFVG